MTVFRVCIGFFFAFCTVCVTVWLYTVFQFLCQSQMFFRCVCHQNKWWSPALLREMSKSLIWVWTVTYWCRTEPAASLRGVWQRTHHHWLQTQLTKTHAVFQMFKSAYMVNWQETWCAMFETMSAKKKQLSSWQAVKVLYLKEWSNSFFSCFLWLISILHS